MSAQVQEPGNRDAARFLVGASWRSGRLAFVTSLLRAGLISPGPSGFYDEDAVTVATMVRDMAGFGLEVRHLRAFKAAADREAVLVAQIAAPVAKGRDAGARDRAEELVRELAALSVTLHSCLVKAAVRDSLDS